MRIFVSMPHGAVWDSYFNDEAIARLKAHGATFNESDKQLTPEALRAVLMEHDVLITGWGHLDLTRELVAGTALKLVVHTGGSVAALAPVEVFEEGVRVLTGNDYFAESVAEGVIAYCLYTLRKMPLHSVSLSERGVWIHNDGETANEGLLDQTVGIVSVGAISKHVMQMGKAFRLKFKVFSTRRDEALAKELGFTYADSLDELFTSCKIVSVHTASSAATRHMINRNLLSLLTPGQILINTSRGPVVDEDALAEMLAQKRFRAVLDVYSQEPLPAGHPLIGLENAVLFPHVGGPTFDRRTYITNRLIDDIESFMAGRSMVNEVSMETASRMTKNL